MTVGCPVAILAGGRGTRLGAAAAERPKALVEVAGRPFVFHQLDQLRAAGARDVVLCIGHLGGMIRDAVKDGSALGLRVSYAEDPAEDAGTAAALRNALPLLGDEFLVLYGDTYLLVDFADVYRAFSKSPLPALMTVLRNEGRWGPSNTSVDGGLVTAHDKRHHSPGMEWIDYGLGALAAAPIFSTELDDLSEVYGLLARGGELGAYEVSDRFHEIGTPESLLETDRFLRSLDPAPALAESGASARVPCPEGAGPQAGDVSDRPGSSAQSPDEG